MAACLQLSYYLVTAIQIDSSSVYYLNTDDRSGIYRLVLKKRA